MPGPESSPHKGASTTSREMACELTKIDSGIAWVSPYWGSTGPKLVYDGDAFYTVGLWGSEQATAKGAIYKYQAGRWIKGYEWPGLNYQPGMLLLDSKRRLILIYPRMNAKPAILRSGGNGDITHFDPLPVPDAIPLAGYIGAGIHDDKLVLGYIGRPGVYSFSLASLDLKTMKRAGPYLLAPEQRRTQPFTTWLYPIIQPEEKGTHLVVTNNPGPDRNNLYDSVLYMHIPYSGLPQPPRAEVIVKMVPWTGRIAFGLSMCRTADGSIYVTVLYYPGEKMDPRAWDFCGIRLYRRDPTTHAWDYRELPEVSGSAAVFEDRREPGTLWLTTTARDTIRFSLSRDQGRHWEPMPALGTTAPNVGHPFFFHQISPSSGSVMPQAPCTVFSTGSAPACETWFMEVRAKG